MAKHLNLQVPDSCQEDWTNMVPEHTGRYCNACQKSVVDFTEMTDVEIIQYFRTRKGSTCGRFTQSQLNRDIPITKKPLPWLKYFFTFSLPAFLLSLKVSAQGQRISAPIEVSPIRPKANVLDSSKGVLPLTGIVYNEAGVPIVEATVIIKGSNKGTVTDAKGRFSLITETVPATLLISYVGYDQQEVVISSDQQSTEVKLQPSPALLGEVVVGYAVSKKINKRQEKKTEKKQKPSPEYPSIQAYPNPVIAGNSLNLKCRSFEKGDYNAEVYTLSGQLVQVSKVNYTRKDSSITLRIDQLVAGTYLLRLINEKTGKQYSQQVVVQN